MRFALVIIETAHSKRQIRDDRAGHRARLEAWSVQQAQAGKLVGGEAFETETIGPVTVRRDDSGQVTVTEGPFADERETLGGYMLIDVADRDEAVALAASWPTAKTIEVRPIWVAS